MHDTAIDFSIDGVRGILERTPKVLRELLLGLDEAWIRNSEGPETWSPFDILGHLIHGERTDWITRAKIILNDGTEGTFVPFDRFAQFEESKGKNLLELLNEFQEIRDSNLNELENLKIDDVKLALTSHHPEFGIVTLRQLLATWAVHDLAHINQMSRVLAKQYKEETGPWVDYISVLRER